MADLQGTCSYAELPIIGGEYTESRGVQPGVFRLRVSAKPVQPKFVGPLTLRYGGNVMVFQDCALGPHITRIWKGRIPYCWSIKVYDKRWKWRYARISGRYNVRKCDGKIQESTRKNLSELIDLLMQSLADINSAPVAYTKTDIPNVYPYVDWQNAYSAREIEQLLDWAGLAIAPQRDGSFSIQGLGRGSSLPNLPNTITRLTQYNNATMPSSVEVHFAPTIQQSKFTLEPVGLDTDGSIKVIDDLSYTPDAAWETQWPTTFADVAAAERHLAFQTLWRWFRIKDISTPSGTYKVKDIELLDHLTEVADDDLDQPRCMQPVVVGEFWPRCDRTFNTEEDAVYTAPFRILKEYNILEFEYPVHKIVAGQIVEPALKAFLAYRVRDPDTAAPGKYLRHKVVLGNPQAIAATPPRIDKRPYLARVICHDAHYGQAGDNLSEVNIEGNGYLNGIIPTYAGGPEVDMLYSGLMPIQLSGRVAQIKWHWGHTRAATTRASENHEFDTTQRSHQERRRLERLGQLYDKVVES